MTHDGFAIGDDAQPPGLRPCIAQEQPRDPDRIGARHELYQFAVDAIRLMLEPAVAEAVAHDVRTGPCRKRQRARSR